MNIEEHINYWLESAKNDMDVAESLFKSQKYDWCLFIGHLVLEKTFKALYVKNNANKIPPRIHNLVKLAELSPLKLSDKQKFFLDEVNDFNLEIRYPDYKFEFRNICDMEFTTKYFDGIKEFFKWQQSLLK